MGDVGHRCVRCGGDLPAARRASARNRARGHTCRVSLPASDLRTARRSTPSSRWQPSQRGPPADAARSTGLESRLACRRRACRVPPAGGVPSQFLVRRCRGSVRRAGSRRLIAIAGPQVVGRDGGHERPASVPAPRDSARLRRRASRRGRRGRLSPRPSSRPFSLLG